MPVRDYYDWMYDIYTVRPHVKIINNHVCLRLILSLWKSLYKS